MTHQVPHACFEHAAGGEPDDAREARPELSIVVPALDEQENIEPLTEEIRRTIVERGIASELIVVDDHSGDATLARARELAQRHAWVRVVAQAERQGQSAAMFRGIEAARGRFVATLDADLQNDPADLPAMLEWVQRGEADMVQGDRSSNRRDNLIRRFGSRVGRAARWWVLGDPTRDTGCSARVVRVELARRLPLYLHGMHRFMPVCARMLGARVIEHPVGHRPRHAGQTKYGLGVLNRAFSGLVDCLAVRWMIARCRAVPLTDCGAWRDRAMD